MKMADIGYQEFNNRINELWTDLGMRHFGSQFPISTKWQTIGIRLKPVMQYVLGPIQDNEMAHAVSMEAIEAYRK